MKRAVLTLSGTVAGLAALFSFKSHVPGIADASAASTPTTLPASAPAVPESPSASPTLKSPAAKPSSSKTAKAKPKASDTPTASMTAPATTTAPTTGGGGTTPTAAPSTATPTKTASAPASSTPTPTPTPSTSAPAGKSGTFTGPDQSTQYGDVQVQITVSDGKITNATDLVSPADSIGANAVSQLNSEVISAQSASVQAVSGATYTSDGYIASLQSAVDSAGL